MQLRIRDRQESQCVAKWEPARDLRVHTVVGRRRPLCVASSKVLLAHKSEDKREAILAGPLKRFTPNTITDPRRLRTRLEQIRKSPFSVSRDEMNEDLISITAPVFLTPGQVLAALNTAAPATRVEARIDELGAKVAEAARRISVAMGYRPSADVRTNRAERERSDGRIGDWSRRERGVGRRQRRGNVGGPRICRARSRARGTRKTWTSR